MIYLQEMHKNYHQKNVLFLPVISTKVRGNDLNNEKKKKTKKFLEYLGVSMSSQDR